MSLNTVKRAPSDFIKMMEIIQNTLHTCGEISHEQLACEIANALRTAGYEKQDLFLLGFFEQLRHGLIAFQKNLKEIKERVSYLDMTEERCNTILGLLEHEKQRRKA